jgi:hypothetical protein
VAEGQAELKNKKMTLWVIFSNLIKIFVNYLLYFESIHPIFCHFSTIFYWHYIDSWLTKPWAIERNLSSGHIKILVAPM